MNDIEEAKRRWEMERKVEEHDNTLVALRALPTEMARIGNKVDGLVTSQSDQKEDIRDLKDEVSSFRDDARRSKRDILVALAAFASPVVVTLIAYILGVGH